jgi:hypothetical protein
MWLLWCNWGDITRRLTSPLSLAVALTQVLQRVLPGAAGGMPAVDEDVEEIAVSEVDVESVKERQRLMRSEESDDEGMPRGAQRVQCAQQ